MTLEEGYGKAIIYGGVQARGGTFGAGTGDDGQSGGALVPKPERLRAALPTACSTSQRLKF